MLTELGLVKNSIKDYCDWKKRSGYGSDSPELCFQMIRFRQFGTLFSIDTVPTVSVAGHPVEIIRLYFDCLISISPNYIGPT